VAEERLALSLDVSAVPTQAAGAGHYTIELTKALAGRGDLDLVLVSRTADAARWTSLSGTARVEAVAPGPRPLRLAWEQVRLGALVGRLGRAVHHGPHYTMPERSSVPAVVTVHDLSFFTEPSWHERSKAVLFRRAIRVASRRAAALVCPSQVTADDLARVASPVGPVFVAHHGVDAERFSPSPPAGVSDADRVAGLDGRLLPGRPTVVFVGTLEPRKDVPTLVRAFARVAGRHPDALLVLAGGRGWGADDVDRAVAATGLGARVVRLGYVDDDAVPALLRTATVVAYPARYEGFGLPALEALACGAPVVTTRGTAMAEVAAGAAVLVDPGDERQLADALDTGLTGGPTDEAAERRRQGLAVARGHTWAASAARHVEAYRHAAGALGADTRSVRDPLGYGDRPCGP
jgi:glycosyltransferase involved in cell wall biosynthesis